MAKINSTRRNKAFDLPTAPSNRLEGNRWLSYATFGAGTAETNIAASTKTSIVPITGLVDDVTKLNSMGYEAYVNEQLADNSIPDIFFNNKNTTGGFGDQTFGNSQAQLFAWFFAEAIHGTAQIRLKMTYALSQIFVVNGNVNGMIPYYRYVDLLVKSTLSTNTSSFRTLLDDITYSYAMATMLSYKGNKKENLTTNSRPDENYAREILQLFTIGLKQLNIDGTARVDANGVDLDSYTVADIPELAKIFTGLEGVGSGFGPQDVPRLTELDYVSDHSTSQKTLFAYPGGSPLVIPAYTGTYFRYIDAPPNAGGYVIKNVTADTFDIDLLQPGTDTRGGLAVGYSMSSNFSSPIQGSYNRVVDATVGTISKTAHGLVNGTRVWMYSVAQMDIKTTLDYIFNHPNVGPFIAKSFIKFFVTSNPTPDFVKRVALKFNNNGNGVRGDLSAVVKAILLDREAILPFGINPNNHGRFTTLPDRYIRVSRAFRSDMVHANVENHNLPDRTFDFSTSSSWFTKPRTIADYHACAILNTGSIMPFKSASVFNFFRPGYTPPGTKVGLLGKTGPEMQINTVDAQIRWNNAINALCETETSGVGSSAFLDPSGNSYTKFGFDFLPDAGGFTVTNATTKTVQGIVTSNQTGGDSYFQFKVIRRSDNKRMGAGCFRPTGTGLKTFNIDIGDPLTIGDVLDFSPMAILGSSGFPSRATLTGGGDPYAVNFHPMLVLFHKVSAFFVDDVTAPTTAALNSAIDYLESILMTRQISAAGRALMIQAGQLPTTAGTLGIVGDAAFNNNWLNVNIGHAQKRARRMTGILLALPEFSVQR